MNEQRVFGITGWKNSGKTTLVCKLVEAMTKRGFKISTIKHAHESFDMDHQGRDSYRHRESGASQVAVSSKTRFAIVHELRGEEEPKLKDILSQMQPVDLVIIEGYKQEGHKKIECRRLQGRSKQELAKDDPSIIAIASDFDLQTDLPNFDLNNADAITDFILQTMGLPIAKGI